MIVSDRRPLISCPVASLRSSLRVRPCLLSDPVISQFVPAPWTGRLE